MSADPLATHDAGRSPATRRARRLWLRRAGLAALLAIWAGTGIWQTSKPLPAGVRIEPPWQSVRSGDLRLLIDTTTADGYGRAVLSQEIFDNVLAVIDQAREFLVLDFFLFNDKSPVMSATDPPRRELSRELRDALVRRKKAHPDLEILFITDPINDAYGGDPSPQLAALREAGIDVVRTDLDRLRDSNPIYSALWRLGVRWWAGSGSGGDALPDPLDGRPSRAGFASWARLLNFKANHRKVVIGDDGHGGLTGVIASANPHDASSAHSNAGLRLTGPVLEPLLASELAIARFSGWRGQLARVMPPPERPRPPPASEAEFAAGTAVRVRVLTEGSIRKAIVGRIDATVEGDAIDAALFYLADRPVVESLLRASGRGVAIRLILDPGKDAFGRAKSGLPNRPVATELAASSDGAIKVRWYRTHGEQFHTKLLAVYDSERLWFTLGSANFTRRNLADYNLEANVAVEAARTSAVSVALLRWFDTLWANRAPAGIEYTADFGVYADPAQSRYWLYRVMEASGLSTF